MNAKLSILSILHKSVALFSNTGNCAVNKTSGKVHAVAQGAAGKVQGPVSNINQARDWCIDLCTC